MVFETLAVSSTAVRLATATYDDDTDQVTITVADASIRYRVDGTAPTATVGHLATAGSVITLDRYTEYHNFLAIAVSADAILSITARDKEDV